MKPHLTASGEPNTVDAVVSATGSLRRWAQRELSRHIFVCRAGPAVARDESIPGSERTSFRARAADPFARIEPTWRAERIEYRIGFARIAEKRSLGRSRRLISLAGVGIFVVFCRTAKDDDTVVSCVAFMRAAAPGEPCRAWSVIRSGGNIRLRVHGWAAGERGLQAVDVVAANQAEDVAPSFGPGAHNRFDIGDESRPYTLQDNRGGPVRRKARP